MMNRLVRSDFSATFGDKRPVELFAPGSFTIGGQREVYDRDRIARIAANTRRNAERFPGLARLPLKASSGRPHTDGALDQIGWIDPASLQVSEDGRLLAMADVTHEDARKRLEEGTWRYVSVELYGPEDRDENTGHLLGEALRGASVVPHPKHKGVGGFVFAEELAEGRVAPDRDIRAGIARYYGNESPGPSRTPAPGVSERAIIEALAGRGLTCSEVSELARRARAKTAERLIAPNRDAIRTGIRGYFGPPSRR